MTKAETAKLLAYIAIAYPRGQVEPNEPTVNLWEFQFRAEPVDLVKGAVDAMIATSPYPPAISDVHKAIAIAKSDARGDMSAGDALEKLRRSFRLYGYYKPTEARAFLGEQIWRVVTMVGGSYVDLCMCEDPNWPARFLHLYAAQAENDQRQLQIPAQVREHLMALGAGRVVKQIGGGVANVQN